MTLIDINDPSIFLFIQKLNKIFETETLNYSFYDFEKEIINDRTKLFILLEKINRLNNNMTTTGIIIHKHQIELSNIYDTINSNLLNYKITNIFNIKCGRLLKYKTRTDLPIQLYDKYYYSFTVCYKKREILLPELQLTSTTI